MATSDDVLYEIAGRVRSSMWTNGPSEERLGKEPDDFGFVEITLSHGLTKRLFAAVGEGPETNDGEGR